MHVLLKTRRLILRCFEKSDLDHLFALDNDPEVMRYINGGTPTPREIIEKKILPKFMHHTPQYPIFGFWAVIAKCTGDFVGWLSFRPQQDHPLAIQLGYRFCKAAWGKGYATEGARALIHKGFVEQNIQSVVATTYEKNIASRRVMEKIGMTFNRAFRLTPADLQNTDTTHTASDEIWDGDDVEYVLKRSDWARQN